MNFNKHYNLIGQHAPFSASQGFWINYDEHKIIDYAASLKAKEIGTEIHEYAQRAITLGIKQAPLNKTLNMYINDAIGYGMTPEQVLYYSDNFFGTADTILFDSKDNVLRIHDLKTGKNPAHLRQLEIYAALFCLEYRFNPFDLTIELAIYQNDDIHSETADPEEIKTIMDKIVNFDKVLTNYTEEGIM